MATRLLLVSTLGLLLTSFNLPATDAAPPNYDETKVPKYELPNPLVMLNGEKVTDAATWVSKRRHVIQGVCETRDGNVNILALHPYSVLQVRAADISKTGL